MRTFPRVGRTAAVAVVALALLAQACGDDDDSARNDVDREEHPLVAGAADDYKQYVVDQVDELVEDLSAFTDAVRAGDIDKAKEEFAPSRQAWERIEPIAGLVEAIDVAVDARVDDFEDEEDPDWTGWHRLEYLLWEEESLDGADEFADALDADIARLAREIGDVEINASDIAVGASELIEEVSGGKITGEEDRYSHTDLWDFAANVAGSKAAVDVLRDALEDADPDLLADIDDDFDELDAQLSEYREGAGYVSYEELANDDKDDMKATLASLSERLSQMAGVLGLD